MSRRRQRSDAHRARRQKRHAGRHVFIEEPLPNGGWKVTEYRRDQVVSFEICPNPAAEVQ